MVEEEEEVVTQLVFGWWGWEEAEGGRGCHRAVSDWVAVLPEEVVQSPASSSDGWLTGIHRGEPWMYTDTYTCIDTWHNDYK